jgi:hypothetical protein
MSAPRVGQQVRAPPTPVYLALLAKRSRRSAPRSGVLDEVREAAGPKGNVVMPDRPGEQLAVHW